MHRRMLAQVPLFVLLTLQSPPAPLLEKLTAAQTRADLPFARAFLEAFPR